MRLILYDVDGTLVDAGGAGSRALLATLAEIHRRPFNRKGVQYAGRTDRAIIADLMRANGVPAWQREESIGLVFEELPRLMKAELEMTPSVAYPGVRSLLKELARADGVILGLLTGNLYATACLKLETAGLDSSRFLVGAFGDEAADRNELPPLALRRASSAAEQPITAAIVRGDTPADIECARASGMRAAAAATGASSLAELEAFQPDFLFHDLSHFSTIARTLTGRS